MTKRATIGCDPEFFLLDPKENLISAIGIIPGTKYEPHKLPNGGGLQTDNVALEFSSPIANSGKDLVNKLEATFKDIKKYLPEGYSITATPSAIFDKKELDTPEAQEFGCDPDFNAWKLAVNEVPSHPNEKFRSCGGHVHVGQVKGDGNEFLSDPYGKVEVVKAMDLLHGIVSTILDNSKEAIERRKLYGSAGCHRPTEYGVEYRVLSNFWMKSPNLVMLIDSLTQDALKLVREGKHTKLIDEIGEDEIQNIINDGKTSEAKYILDKYLKEVISEDSKYYLDECIGKEFNQKLEMQWMSKGGK